MTLRSMQAFRLNSHNAFECKVHQTWCGGLRNDKERCRPALEVVGLDLDLRAAHSRSEGNPRTHPSRSEAYGAINRSSLSPMRAKPCHVGIQFSSLVGQHTERPSLPKLGRLVRGSVAISCST